jgi:hypothetical protein
MATASAKTMTATPGASGDHARRSSRRAASDIRRHALLRDGYLLQTTAAMLLSRGAASIAGSHCGSVRGRAHTVQPIHRLTDWGNF